MEMITLYLPDKERRMNILIVYNMLKQSPCKKNIPLVGKLHQHDSQRSPLTDYVFYKTKKEPKEGSNCTGRYLPKYQTKYYKKEQ